MATMMTVSMLSAATEALCQQAKVGGQVRYGCVRLSRRRAQVIVGQKRGALVCQRAVRREGPASSDASDD